MEKPPEKPLKQSAMTGIGLFLLIAATATAVYYKEATTGAALAVVALVWLLASRLV